MFDADHGGASRPGYMGHRPGEKADPYVLASTTRRFKTPSWMVDTKPASMAQVTRHTRTEPKLLRH